MASMPVSSTQAKTMTLGELRVFELKQELEKRGLDKSGIKLALVERLEEALREEGYDPKTYKFSVNDCSRSPANPLKNSNEVVKEANEHGTGLENGLEDGNREAKEENIGEEDSDITIIEPAQKVEATKKIGYLAMTKMEETEIEETKVKHKIIEEDDSKVGSIKESMDINKVLIEETIISKQTIEADELKEEETLKELGEEINYEDEEMSDVTRINEEEFKATESKRSASELTEEKDEKICDETMEEKIKTPKGSNNSFTSTVETVASTPADRVGGTVHTVTSVLKKSDNSLWIKGISPNTKAADLKAMFAKYGRVLTAKIFTRRQQPSSACFGFVTMVDATVADLCIQKLHKTTVKGRPITVERADRCNMPTVKSIPKKPTSNTTSDAKTGKPNNVADSCSKSSDEKCSVAKTSDKSKRDGTSGANLDKPKSGVSGGDKAESVVRNEKQKSTKVVSETKKSPVKAPSTSTTHTKFSSVSNSNKRSAIARLPSRFRVSRRIESIDRVSSSLRRSYAIRKPSYSSAASRRTLGGRSFPSRISRGSMLRGMVRREVSSRRVEPPNSWEKREMMEMLRKKEEEHRLKEQELRLQRERERLKFERERFERERLELQQLRQIAALTTPVQMMPSPGAPPARRSHDYGDVESSRYKSEKDLKRTEYGRRSGERSSTHHTVTSASRSSLSDRREPHSSSRHINSTHSSSRVSSGRSRERSRDRSRHSAREYGSSNVNRENVTNYSRDSHSYSLRDPYRSDSTTYNNHRSSDAGYANRELTSYSSSNGYSRDLGSSYSKDSGYGTSSRSVGNASWPVGGSSSTYVGPRDYDSGAWLPSVSSSQNHGLGSNNWPSRDDHWSSSSLPDTHGHISSYDKYVKYDYDKYSRRY
ncbi:unnamed protein product [Thelazia callipaeda]|uniref:SAFB-like transcription modulator n=1 Tax=Thelazia callipaeda TaxID=103827 RepID=A0A0N5CLE9_THECL|nr:unnamed protein product [Thelazia callipaeda]